MNSATNPRQLILAYLLGELPVEDRRAVEMRMVSDRAFSHNIRQAEHDMLEDYRTHRVSAEEKRRIEEAFAREHLFLGLPIRLEPPRPAAPRAAALLHTRNWRWWLRLSVATAGLILMVAAAWIGVRYLQPRVALPKTVQRALPLATSAVNGTILGGRANETAVLLLAPAVADGVSGATLHLRPTIHSVRVAWVVPANVVARTFELSVLRGQTLLSTIRQHNGLREIGGSREADFRVDTTVFSGYQQHPGFLFEIRAVEHPNMVVAEYPVTVSAYER